MIKIRQEVPCDYAEVYELVKKSFATSSYSDGTEQDYLNELRKKDTFIQELSLVSENDEGKLIGQIVLYKMKIVSAEKEFVELVLSPICVHPDYFRRGIARALMEKAFEIAKNMDFKAVFLCGDPSFYRKIGFKPTFEYNIFHIDDKLRNAEYCMAHELIDGALRDISGTIDIE